MQSCVLSACFRYSGAPEYLTDRAVIFFSFFFLLNSPPRGEIKMALLPFIDINVGQQLCEVM